MAKNPKPQAVGAERDRLPFWKRLHYNIGANELPGWQQVLFYGAIAILVLLLLRLVLFG